MKKSASGEHKGQGYKQMEEKERKHIQKHFIFLYVSVHGWSRDVCASQRRTVNWRWYDCAGIITLRPRPQHHPPIRDDIWQGGAKIVSMTNMFPVGGVIVRAVIGCFATLPRKDITLATLPVSCFSSHPHWSSIHPLPVERRRQTAYRIQFILCGRATHSLPVADVITQLTGHAADQLPVVFLVITLKLKMSTTDQCCPAVEYEVRVLVQKGRSKISN